MLVLGLALGVWLFSSEHGTLVTIENVDDDDLSDVTVFVTGHSYYVGMIKSRESSSIRVYPRADSHVEVEVTSTKVKAKRLVIGAYIAPNVRGSIRARISAHGIVALDSDV